MLPPIHSPLSPISLQTLVFDGRPGTIMSSRICRSRNLNFKDFRCRCVITLQYQHFLRFSPKQHQTSNKHVTPAAARQSFVPQELPLFPLFPLLNLPSAGVPPWGQARTWANLGEGREGREDTATRPAPKGNLNIKHFCLNFKIAQHLTFSEPKFQRFSL